MTPSELLINHLEFTLAPIGGRLHAANNQRVWVELNKPQHKPHFIAGYTGSQTPFLKRWLSTPFNPSELVEALVEMRYEPAQDFKRRRILAYLAS